MQTLRNSLFSNSRLLLFFVLSKSVSAQTFSAKGDTAVICGIGVSSIGVTVSDGVEPFEYQWSTGQTEPIITPFVANSANFKVTVRDANGRSAVTTARIIVNEVPEIRMEAPAPVWCLGQTADINMRAAGAYPLSFEYTIDGVLQPPVSEVYDRNYIFPVNQPGLYQITRITDVNGCEGTGQNVLYVAKSDFDAEGEVRDIDCNGNAKGAITVAVTGGEKPYQYQWSGPQNIGNIANPSGLNPGLYFLSVTDKRGCRIEQEYEVSQAPPLVANILEVKPVDCNGGGAIEMKVSGGRPLYKYDWNNGLTVEDPKNLNAGTYTVTITDRSGCTATATAAIGLDIAAPHAVAAPALGILTCDSNTVILNGSGSEAGPGIIYRWSAAPGFITNGPATVRPQVNQPGVYELFVINQRNGCVASAKVKVVAEKNYPVSNPSIDQRSTCAVANATLSGKGSAVGNNYSYEWSTASGGAVLGGSTTLNPIVKGDGVYVLKVTDTSNGCASTASVSVIKDTKLPTAKIATPAVLSCIAGSVVLDGSQSAPKDSLTFKWTTQNGAFVSSAFGPQVSVSGAGAYALIVTDKKNGCSATANVAVQHKSTPVKIVIKTTGALNCAQSTVTLDASETNIANGAEYEWQTDVGHFAAGKNTLTPVVDAPGIYTLIVSSKSDNCTTAASVTITHDIEVPLAIAGPANTLNCVQRQLTLGAPQTQTANSPLQYSWQAGSGGRILTGANTPNPVVDRPGIYTLTVFNNTNKCRAVSTVKIAEDTLVPMAMIAPPDTLTCKKTLVWLDGSASSAGPAIRYSWQTANPSGILSGDQSSALVVAKEGDYTLLVTNQINGCTATATTRVKGNPDFPVSTVSASGIITCNQPFVQIKGVIQSNVPNAQYEWKTVYGNIVSGQHSLLAEVDKPGIYSLMVTNPANGCSSIQNLLVTADQNAPKADIGQDKSIDCKLTPVTLEYKNFGDFEYKWSVVDKGNIMTPTDLPTVQVNQPGNYQLLVRNRQTGCTATDNILVTLESNTPVPVIEKPLKLTCDRLQMQLDATQSVVGSTGFSYQWSGPGVTSGGTTLRPTVNLPGIYTLVINNGLGCTAAASVDLLQDNTPPESNIGGADLVLTCRKPELPLGAKVDALYAYHWSGPDIAANADMPNPVVKTPGTYTLVATNRANGCKTTDLVQVTAEASNVTADAGPTFQLTCFQKQYLIQATAAGGSALQYAWSTAGGHIVSGGNTLNPMANAAGRYFLTVTDGNTGCTALASVQIYQAPEVPIASAGVNATLTCTQSVLTLDGTGSSSGSNMVYGWSTEGTGHILSGDKTRTPEVDQPGVYVLTVRDTFNECTAVSSVTVKLDRNAPDIEAGKAPVLSCQKDTTALSGIDRSNGQRHYQWSTKEGIIVSGDTTLAPYIKKAGWYFLTATNPQNGCVSVDSVQVSGDFTVLEDSIIVSGVLDCRNLVVKLQSQLPTGMPVAYEWTTQPDNMEGVRNAAFVYANQPGDYTMVVRNVNSGCADTVKTTLIQDNAVPKIEVGKDTVITCKSPAIRLNAQIEPLDSGYFFQWFTSYGRILQNNSNTLTPVISASGTYMLAVINEKNGCITTDSVRIADGLTPPRAAIAEVPLITCTMPVVPLDGSASVVHTDTRFVWVANGGNLLEKQDAKINRTDMPGYYYLILSDTLSGCFDVDTVLADANLVQPIAEAGIPFTLTCSVAEKELQGYSSLGSVYEFKWSTPDGKIISGSNMLNPVVNLPGTYYLDVKNRLTGCQQRDSVVILRELKGPDSLSVQLDSINCRTQTASVLFLKVKNGTGPYFYSIDGGQHFSSSIYFGKLTDGNYMLAVQDVNGCKYTQPLQVPKAFIPEISVDPEMVTASPGDSIPAKVILSDNYPLSKIDSVFWTPPASVFFNGNDIEAQLNPVLIPKKTTAYAVTLVSKDGCRSSGQVLVKMDKKLYVFVANAFSPESAYADNNRLLVSAADDAVEAITIFRVFDRWGSLLHEARNFLPNDPAAGWDGTASGKLLPPGIYSWYLEAKLKSGESILFQGDSALVR